MSTTGTHQSPLEKAKALITIPQLAATLFPDWRPGKSCRSPFREDRHASFSVYDDGRKWKDHATGDGGSVVDFLAVARGISTADASRELIAIAGTSAGSGGRGGQRIHSTPTTPAGTTPAGHCPTCWSHGVAAIAAGLTCVSMHSAGSDIPRDASPPAAMPKGQRKVWDEGLEYLRGNESLQETIAQWRAWPAYIVRTLADDGLMGSPLVAGKRTIAFPVQEPYVDELGCVSTIDVGFHARIKPAHTGDRAKWTYQPSCTALPFVIGGGFVPHARTIVVCEGQFDSVALAAAGGWMVSEPVGRKTWHFSACEVPEHGDR